MHRLVHLTCLLATVSLIINGCGRNEPPATASATPATVALSASTQTLATATTNPTATTIPTANPTQTPWIVQQVITAEVTRIVEKQLVVEVTPTPLRSCAETRLDQVETLVIGALAPLSGENAAAGLSLQAGLNIATAAINGQGGVKGKPIRLITYDTAGKADVGVTRAEQLVTQDCAVALVGVYHTDVALAVRSVAHRFGVPLIAVETYGDALTDPAYPEVFRIAPTVSQLAQLSSNWMQAVGDYNGDDTLTAVLVVENSDYGRTHVDSVTTWLQRANIRAEALFVDLPTDDFSAIVARIVEMEYTPDVIFVRLMGDTGLLLIKQLIDNGLAGRNKSLLVATQSALNSAHYWETVGEKGAHVVALRLGPWPSTVGEMGQQFAQNYRTYFDRWPDNGAFSAHDAIYLVADAISRSDSLRGADLIEALEGSDLELAAGRYRFSVTSAAPLTTSAATSATVGVSTTLALTEMTWQWHQWLDVPLLYLQYTEPLQDSAQMAVIWPPIYRTVSVPVIKP